MTRLTLVDDHPDVVVALRVAFGKWSEVAVVEGDILTVAENGASLIVPTAHPRIPYMIVAPTMLSPEQVDPVNAYRAMRAVLRVAQDADAITHVFCPGLCTGVGGVNPERAATEMASAYADWKLTAP